MGLSPWLFNRQTIPYSFNGGNPLTTAPSTTAVAFPTSATFGTAPTSNSDFDPNWRAAFATLERIDLSQNPPSYPHQAGGVPGAVPSYFSRFDSATFGQPGDATTQLLLAAQSYRQSLADQIYRRLLIVTGAQPPANLATPAANDPNLPVLRWLGQLAVNIVDFIDEDEISTPFNFYATAYNFFTALTTGTAQTLPAAAYNTSNGQVNTVNTDPGLPQKLAAEAVLTYWVFGTELPAVVLNEVNTEYTIPAPTATTPNPQFNVLVWTELYCPFPVPLNPNNPSVQPQDNQNAAGIPLYIPGAGGLQPISPYKVAIANRNTTANFGPLYPPPVDTSSNAAGTPDQVRNEAVFTNPTTPTVNGTGNVATAIPSGGYFLVGADSDDSGGSIKMLTPGTTPWYQSSSMRYQVTFNSTANTWQLATSTGTTTITDGGAGATNITILLRRLANPHLPANTDPTSAFYNPYVTVDYLNNIPLNNSSSGTMAAPNSSLGKLQPYASDNSAGAAPPSRKSSRTPMRPRWAKRRSSTLLGPRITRTSPRPAERRPGWSTSTASRTTRWNCCTCRPSGRGNSPSSSSFRASPSSIARSGSTRTFLHSEPPLARTCSTACSASWRRPTGPRACRVSVASRVESTSTPSGTRKSCCPCSIRRGRRTISRPRTCRRCGRTS